MLQGTASKDAWGTAQGEVEQSYTSDVKPLLKS